MTHDTLPVDAQPVEPLRDLPERVVVGSNGAYWRDYGDHYSMCPVSTDNDPVEPVAVYVRRTVHPITDYVADVYVAPDPSDPWRGGRASPTPAPRDGLLRAQIERDARLDDALDALQIAVLWHHGHHAKPGQSWENKARSGIVGLAALHATATEPSKSETTAQEIHDRGGTDIRHQPGNCRFCDARRATEPPKDAER